MGIELAAIRSGLLLAIAKGTVYLIIGTDEWISNVSNLVDDIWMLQVQLGNEKVVYQLCEGKCVAHAMAQIGLREGTQFFYKWVSPI